MGLFIIFIYYIYLIFFSFWLGLWIFACHAAEHVKQEPSIASVLKAETEKKKTPVKSIGTYIVIPIMPNKYINPLGGVFCCCCCCLLAERMDLVSLPGIGK